MKGFVLSIPAGFRQVLAAYPARDAQDLTGPQMAGVTNLVTIGTVQKRPQHVVVIDFG
jgi:hypothetical protein